MNVWWNLLAAALVGLFCVATAWIVVNFENYEFRAYVLLFGCVTAAVFYFLCVNKYRLLAHLCLIGITGVSWAGRAIAVNVPVSDRGPLQVFVDGANWLDPIALTICFVTSLLIDLARHDLFPYLRHRLEVLPPERTQEPLGGETSHSSLSDGALELLESNGERLVDLARQLGRQEERVDWLTKQNTRVSAETSGLSSILIIQSEIETLITTTQSHLDELDYDKAFTTASALATWMESHGHAILPDITFKSYVLLADVARLKHETAVASGEESTLAQMHNFIKKAKHVHR